jgi:hypothetical protein
VLVYETQVSIAFAQKQWSISKAFAPTSKLWHVTKEKTMASNNL